MRNQSAETAYLTRHQVPSDHPMNTCLLFFSMTSVMYHPVKKSAIATEAQLSALVNNLKSSKGI